MIQNTNNTSIIPAKLWNIPTNMSIIPQHYPLYEQHGPLYQPSCPLYGNIMKYTEETIHHTKESAIKREYRNKK